MRRREITDSTNSVACGPVSINCDLARKHGWTNGMLEKAEREIQKLARRFGGYAKRRAPHLFYTTPDGVVLFVGDMDGRSKAAMVRRYEKLRTPFNQRGEERRKASVPLKRGERRKGTRRRIDRVTARESEVKEALRGSR